ncbi:MAG: amidohydrolase family protein [Hyphomicrobiales bacterium]|nr:amidohydrolase family protein [Hyphomicrobiales bacterium]
MASNGPSGTVEYGEMESRSLGALPVLDEAARAAMPGLISTDSHVAEPDDLWKRNLPERLARNIPTVKIGLPLPGATDPRARLVDQDRDGLAAEVLFPNNGMALFGLDDVETQVEGFRVYNDWLADYCKTDRKRLFGIPCVSVYDIDGAIKEMQRGHDMGMVGVMVWQVPDPRLPFMSDHYDRLWAAAAECNAPIVCHILTGHSYAKDFSKRPKGNERIRNAVNRKEADTINTLFDFIFSGAFEKYPNLKLLLSESEIGWVPFMLQQWDYYFERFRKSDHFVIKRMPSEIFADHVYCTFLEDFVGTRAFSWWGEKNCMWSSDYPHYNMSFPHSRENVEKHLAGLPDGKRRKLVRDNAIQLFGLDVD